MSTTATEVDPAIVAIEESTELVVQQAQAIRIIDAETNEGAAVFLTETLKPALKEIEARFRPMQRKADAAKKEILDQRRAIEGPLKEAERIVKGYMGSYEMERRRIAAEEEAERLRLARETAERDALAEASRLEAAGHKEAAEERITAPVVPVLAPPTEPVKPAGVSVKTKSEYRIVDATAIRRKFLQPDTKKIRQIVTSMGADAEELVGGIEVYEQPVVSARAR